MIAVEQVRTARGLSGVADIFCALGYPVQLRPVSPSAWEHANLLVGLDPDWQLYHVCRIGRLDLFFLTCDLTSARLTCSEFLNRYRKWNSVARVVVVGIDHEGFSIHGLDSAGRVRRLDVSLTNPNAEVVDRLNLLERGSEDRNGDISSAFERALERESVTRNFFRGFRSAVERLAAELGGQCSDDADAISSEALLILSRILFLYFIQQRGWLDGDRRFLQDQLNHAIRGGQSYFDTVLRPLFFGCLNTPLEKRDGGARGLGRIPYLNGGLFEPSGFEQRHGSLTVSNQLLQDVVEKTFERHSFCVDEGDEEGVHVDPEMLGKVFESLMAADERLASGSFYTPKPIVDAMTERAIVAWCCGGDERIAESLRNEDRLGGDAARGLLRKVESITVLDPACGSGAFLLSALHLIERLIRRLAAIAGAPVERNLRQKIVERSLFGVDLKPQAVRLCELRLWLSIVSSSEATLESVEPLPNLDRNILQGNALLGPLDYLGGGRAEVYRQWAYALRARRDLVERYRHALPDEKPKLCRAICESDQALAIALLGFALKTDKAELQRITNPVDGLFGPARHPDQSMRPVLGARISATERSLARVQEGIIDFFAFDLHFAQVFASGGFDVVLGNPPWVRTSRIDPPMRRALGERFDQFQAGSGFDQSDLCVAFWEKALRLAGDGGVVAMLLPAKIATAAYASALRRSVVTTTELIAIDDWSKGDLFDADSFPIALTVRNKRPGASGAVAVQCANRRFSVAQNQLSAREAGSPWQIVPPDVLEIVSRIQERVPTLASWLNRRPLMGIKTGANDRFLVSDIELRNGGVYVPALELKLPREAVARCIRGRDVVRWKAGAGTWMLLPPPPSASFPGWISRVANALRIEPEEFRLAYVQPEHFALKVVWKDVSRGLQAVVLPATVNVAGWDCPVVPNQTLYSFEALTLREAFALTALLNSTIFNALVATVADRAKDSHFRYFGRTVGQTPVPRLDPSSEQQRDLAKLSRQAHGGRNVAAQIDQLVRRLYGLSKKQLDVLSTFLAARLGIG